MRYSLLLLFYLFISVTALAQDGLCINKGSTQNSISFDAAQFNNYIHPEKYNAIFFGEQHNPVFDPEIKYYLIKDLNEHFDIRHLFMEMGAAAAWRFNQYLLSGDTSHLRNPSLVYTGNNYIVFWKRLYDYNRTLPADKKLVIHGVDFERTEVFNTLKRLAPKDKAIPAPLKPVTDTINAHLQDKTLDMYIFSNGRMTGTTDNAAFTNTLEYVQDQLLQHIEDTKAYYGENFSVVSDIIINEGEVTVKPKPRNKTMFQVMSRVVNEQHIEKFAGFFGSEHTRYSSASSLPNAARTLKGFNAEDILCITEIVYNIKALNGSPAKVEGMEEAILLNKDCKATIVPAEQIAPSRKKADFVILADAAR